MSGSSTSPVAATTAADPYPYYAGLVRETPIYRDDALGLWVASSADAVTAVLTSPLCRVRPPGEPVPNALLGSVAGEVFRRLVRMNDGGGHCPLKRTISDTLALLDPLQTQREGRRWAHFLSGPLAAPEPGDLARLQFDLSVHVMGTLIGLSEGTLSRLPPLVAAFAGCLAPGGSPEQTERGKAAAAELWDLFRADLAERRATSGGLLPALIREMGPSGHEGADVAVANSIGFLFQAYDATAGLIGNTLLTLARNSGLHEAAERDPKGLSCIVSEVARFDPPIQNTRRWVAEAGVVAGQAMVVGDAILILLAAANRDPAANPEPDRFDPLRKNRCSFTFSAGAHACPGETLATTIAAAGVERVLAAGVDLRLLTGSVSYHPSANARIPIL